MESAPSSLAAIKRRLRIPAFAAPMFLVSGPDLVIAACKAGVIGAFPTINARTTADLEQWMSRIAAEVSNKDAPWAANLIVHRTNPRFEADLAVVLRFKPEIVITALGSPARVVEAVHSYGGLVFADVNSISYARKAVEAGADGLVLVAAGAGGHTGQISAFAFVPAVREFFKGPIVLGGGIATGAGIRAAEVLGADFAYLGTRFIATPESLASETYRRMLVDSGAEDIVCSTYFTGVPANYLKPSVALAGFDPDHLPAGDRKAFDSAGASSDTSNVKAWRDVWSAGHGVGAIRNVQPVAEVVADLKAGYDNAKTAS